MSLFFFFSFSKIHNRTIGFLYINIIQLISKVHLNGGNILLAQLCLFFFLFFCKAYALCLMVKGVDSVDFFFFFNILLLRMFCVILIYTKT